MPLRGCPIYNQTEACTLHISDFHETDPNSKTFLPCLIFIWHVVTTINLFSLQKVNGIWQKMHHNQEKDKNKTVSHFNFTV
jgi:hypothetical protein